MSNADDRSRLKSDVNLEEIRAQARRSAERIQAPPAGGVRSCKRSKPETKSRQVKGGIFGLFTKTEYYTEDVEYLEEKRVCQDHWVLGRRHEEIVSDSGPSMFEVMFKSKKQTYSIVLVVTVSSSPYGK